MATGDVERSVFEVHNDRADSAHIAPFSLIFPGNADRSVLGVSVFQNTLRALDCALGEVGDPEFRSRKTGLRVGYWTIGVLSEIEIGLNQYPGCGVKDL